MIKENLKKKTTYVVFGKVSVFNGVFSISHPEMELKSEFDKSLRSSIQPIYPSTEKLSNRGISNRSLSKLVEHLFQHVGNSFDESLSDEILIHNGLISKKDALKVNKESGDVSPYPKISESINLKEISASLGNGTSYLSSISLAYPQSGDSGMVMTGGGDAGGGGE